MTEPKPYQPFRNAQHWREFGYKVLFRHGLVILADPKEGVLFTTENDAGGWMRHHSLHHRPWKRVDRSELTEEIFLDVETTLAACYCDIGVMTCDFCAGVRQPPEEE